MPLVFVHGVSTRDSADYQARVRKQRAMLAGLALRGLATDPQILNPYWGGFGARPSWDGASLPSGRYEAFGAEDATDALALEVAPGVDGSDPLLALARTDFVAAVDLMWVLLPGDAGAEVVELGAKTLAYAEAYPQPPWLATVANDQQFLRDLASNVDAWQPPAGLAGDATATEWEAFGLTDAWDKVREAATRWKASPARGAGAIGVGMGRGKAQSSASQFLGDVFVYLDKRGDTGTPGPIPTVVIEALDAARAAIDPAKDPYLIVVGHSMGGNIVYDVLTYYRPDIEVDAFVTFGSQVPFFEELKLFHCSDPAIPSDTTPKVALRAGIRRWINVFDRQDILSFSGEAIFERIEDLEYNTGASVLGAHSAYLERPSFHRRLNARLLERLPGSAEPTRIPDRATTP